MSCFLPRYPAGAFFILHSSFFISEAGAFQLLDAFGDGYGRFLHREEQIVRQVNGRAPGLGFDEDDVLAVEHDLAALVDPVQFDEWHTPELCPEFSGTQAPSSGRNSFR
jgi:hypothetical protein